MRDRVARRLLAALAGTTPAFMPGQPPEAPHTVPRRLVAALAGSTPAFSPAPCDVSDETLTPQRRRTAYQVKRPNPALWFYHWRWEILAVTLLPYALVTFILWLGPVRSVVVLSLVSAQFYWKFVRRRTRSRLRAITVQHRLRAAFPLLHLPDGRVPAILWSRPRGGDIVVSLYGREAFEQLHRNRTVLAAVCSAPEVYVDRHPKYVSLVTLIVASPPEQPERPEVTPRFASSYGMKRATSDREG
jgi:hypothetical protein